MLRYIIMCLGLASVCVGIDLEIRTITKNTAGEILQGKISYIKGTEIKHGREAWYDKDGHLIEQMHFINGRKEGRELKYSHEGEVIYDANYKNNKLQGIALIIFLKVKFIMMRAKSLVRQGGITRMAHLLKRQTIMMIY
ncbi:hypothetical protein [uncultured Helicobacter sp.]|uniref:toxin-antitoxin system YwqK family antitoxin n=1 Tax=uncultured Helicobacter sp. TaxID=175537 RepID=UPI0026368787|nr:hypothetical protein [uncultured Helicobacter sp.]